MLKFVRFEVLPVIELIFALLTVIVEGRQWKVNTTKMWAKIPGLRKKLYTFYDWNVPTVHFHLHFSCTGGHGGAKSLLSHPGQVTGSSPGCSTETNMSSQTIQRPPFHWAWRFSDRGEKTQHPRNWTRKKPWATSPRANYMDLRWLW